MILLIGLLLLVIAIPVPGESDKEQEETKRETSVGARSGNGTDAEDPLVGQYEAYLENGWRMRWNVWRGSGRRKW